MGKRPNRSFLLGLCLAQKRQNNFKIWMPWGAHTYMHACIALDYVTWFYMFITSHYNKFNEWRVVLQVFEGLREFWSIPLTLRPCRCHYHWSNPGQNIFHQEDGKKEVAWLWEKGCTLLGWWYLFQSILDTGSYAAGFRCVEMSRVTETSCLVYSPSLPWNIGMGRQPTYSNLHIKTSEKPMNIKCNLHWLGFSTRNHTCVIMCE